MGWRIMCCMNMLTLSFCISISVSICFGVNNGDEYVLTLDHSNFSQSASYHIFLVVQFYAPCEYMHRFECDLCDELSPEYEKAAFVLGTYEPSIVLAKIDGSTEGNKELVDRFDITGYPTIMILQNNGKDIHDYAGPRDADGIVTTLKRLADPPSIEIKTVKDAASRIDEEKISIVGIFPLFSGEEFENFTSIANKLLWESWGYDVFHTSDASLLPRGESLSITTPTLRLLKPYDELFVDYQNFQLHAMENFIVEASIPLVTIRDNNQPQKIKQWLSQLSDEQATLYMDFGNEQFSVFNSKYLEVAAQFKCKGLRFILANAETNLDDLEYSGLRFDQVPLIIIHSNNGPSYMKPNLKPDDIARWLNIYKDGKLKPFFKSQPIPDTNNEPLKVVVANSLQDMVLNSKKNVLLDIDAPNCRHFRKFAPFIPELAILFEKDDDVMVASLDGRTNDVPNDTFDIRSCYTLYFKSANGTLLSYDGDETKEDIISFIRNNRPTHNENYIQSPELVIVNQ